MSNYIEFIHDQSDASLGDTFQDISDNSRVESYNIITKGFFEYPGWYTYYRYTDINKTFFIEKGKLYLNEPTDSSTYYRPTKAKKIYKG